ncbi:small ribosomal subunit protein uS7m-like [Saccostrea echinata]|uniref:small ribosomal subunit protein uS7m-like n=1 Tax=Saccostrea echinata TaxID=191078 RepID=UPI002A80DBFC|nr:small ribosomal subunit protein uS7m-like [Saccostrea echinata]
MALCKGKWIFQTLLGLYKENVQLSYISTNQVLSSMYKDRQSSTQEKSELDALCSDDRPLEKKPMIPARSEVSTSFTYDPIVQKFINLLMRNGCKEKAREITEGALEQIKMRQIETYHKAKTEAEKAMVVTDPIKIFHGAVENCKPLVVQKSVTKGGTSYRIPVYCHDRRKLRLGINFIIDSCRTRRRKVPIEIVLAAEILQAYNNEGNAVGKKQQLHKECEAQRAFAHYRWK